MIYSNHHITMVVLSLVVTFSLVGTLKTIIKIHLSTIEN
jgi:hypothetical protein